MKPWSAENAEGRILYPLRVNGERYRGINVLILWSEAAAKGYANPVWMTLKQANALGGRVRRGEHGTVIVFANKFQKIEISDEGEEIEREIPFLKGYTVFNVEQIERLPDRFYQQKGADPLPLSSHNGRVEEFVANTGADLHHGGAEACYVPGKDRIHMPVFESFRDVEGYYATLLHELTHWTRHPSRLARDFGRKRFGDAGYAMEELVAEIGSAFLCAELEVVLEPRDDHAFYIASWLTVLQNDKRAIFRAAGYAQRAAEYLCSLQAIRCSPSTIAEAA